MLCRNSVLRNFPILEDDFDALTDYELFSKMVGYVKSLDAYVKGKMEDELKAYINQEFNNIMMDTIYDPVTETLVLYLNRSES